MFSINFKKYAHVIFLILSFGCSPFLDEPAPYPPDPNEQDQMMVNSTLKLDQFVPPSPMDEANNEEILADMSDLDLPSSSTEIRDEGVEDEDIDQGESK